MGDRIKIRVKQEIAKGVDTTSFKLGYQVGFREAEAATIERLEDHYEQLSKEHLRLGLEVSRLKRQVKQAELREEINTKKKEGLIALTNSSYQNFLSSEMLKTLTEQIANPPVIVDPAPVLIPDNPTGRMVANTGRKRWLGIDYARGPDYSEIVNMDLSDIEARIVSRILAESTRSIILPGDPDADET